MATNYAPPVIHGSMRLTHKKIKNDVTECFTHKYSKYGTFFFYHESYIGLDVK